MSTQKREKFAVVTTPEKPQQHKPLVHIEGKLTPAQLEAIASLVVLVLVVVVGAVITTRRWSVLQNSMVDLRYRLSLEG